MSNSVNKYFKKVVDKKREKIFVLEMGQKEWEDVQAIGLCALSSSPKVIERYTEINEDEVLLSTISSDLEQYLYSFSDPWNRVWTLIKSNDLYNFKNNKELEDFYNRDFNSPKEAILRALKDGLDVYQLNASRDFLKLILEDIFLRKYQPTEQDFYELTKGCCEMEELLAELQDNYEDLSKDGLLDYINNIASLHLKTWGGITDMAEKFGYKLREFEPQN